MSENGEQSLFIQNRERISLEGIRDIRTFNEETLVLETDTGCVHIRGTGLQVLKFDSVGGSFEASGRVSSVEFNERLPRKAGIAARLFR